MSTNTYKQKIEHFRKGSLNKVINIINGVLFFLFIGAISLFVFLSVLLVGMGMWSGINKTVVSPLYYEMDRHDHEVLRPSEITFLELNEETLHYVVREEVNLARDVLLYGSLNNQAHITSVILNEEALLPDDKDNYLLPSGSAIITFNIEQRVYLDTYQDYTRISLYVQNDALISVTDTFKPLTVEEGEDSLLLVTSASVGEFTPKYQRSPLWAAIVTLYQLVVVYTTLNVIKMIVLKCLTLGKDKEAGKHDEYEGFR